MRPALVTLAALAAASACSEAPSFGATAIELGVLPQSTTIQGRDGGASGRVFGHSVWSYGDTVLNLPDVDGTNWHHNSYSITDDTDAHAPLTFTERLDAAGAPRYFLAPTADEAAFNTAHRGDPCAETPCGARWATWPGAPIWDPVGQRALIFYSLIYAEPGAFNFHGVGSSVAVWTDYAQDPTRPELVPGAAHPTLLFGQDEPAWGSGGYLSNADGLLYVFACHGDDAFAPPCAVARVDPASVTDRTTWRFWDGTTWSADMAKRKTVMTAGSSGLSVGYNQHLRQYVAIYAEPLSNRVVIRTAPAVEGHGRARACSLSPTSPTRARMTPTGTLTSTRAIAST